MTTDETYMSDDEIARIFPRRTTQTLCADDVDIACGTDDTSPMCTKARFCHPRWTHNRFNALMRLHDEPIQLCEERKDLLIDRLMTLYVGTDDRIEEPVGGMVFSIGATLNSRGLIDRVQINLMRAWVMPSYRGQQFGRRLAGHLIHYFEAHPVRTAIRPVASRGIEVSLYAEIPSYGGFTFCDYFCDYFDSCVGRDDGIVAMAKRPWPVRLVDPNIDI